MATRGRPVRARRALGTVRFGKQRCGAFCLPRNRGEVDLRICCREARLEFFQFGQFAAFATDETFALQQFCHGRHRSPQVFPLGEVFLQHFSHSSRPSQFLVGLHKAGEHQQSRRIARRRQQGRQIDIVAASPSRLQAANGLGYAVPNAVVKGTWSRYSLDQPLSCSSVPFLLYNPKFNRSWLENQHRSGILG